MRSATTIPGLLARTIREQPTEAWRLRVSASRRNASTLVRTSGLLREGPPGFFGPMTGSTRTRTTDARPWAPRRGRDQVQTANTDTTGTTSTPGSSPSSGGVEHYRGFDLRVSGHVQRLLRPHADLGHDRRDGAWLVDRNVGGSDFSGAGTAFWARSSSRRRSSATTRRNGRTRARCPAPRTSRSSRRASRRGLPGSGPVFSRTRNSSATCTGLPGPCSWGRTRSRPA